jgi:membrane protease YdiL (CAAX protease family)
VIAEPAASSLALGPVAGVATFVLLAGGRFPLARPRALGRAMLLRWLALSARAGLEEVAWRGVVFGGLLLLVGRWPALVASSLAFALWHWPALRGRCFVHVLTGSTFGVAFLAGGLAAAVLAHVVYNLLVDWAVHAERVRLRGP